MSKRTLITNAAIYAPSVPFATAMLIDGEEIAWIGDHSGAEVHRELADTVIHAQGHFLAPGFVDAHVHATSTGIMLSGLDLTQVKNKTQLLDLLSDYAKHLNGATVLGHGWVQGAGHGVVSVRFETRASGPGLMRTFEIDSAELTAADPVDSLDWPDWVGAELPPAGDDFVDGQASAQGGHH